MQKPLSERLRAAADLVAELEDQLQVALNRAATAEMALVNIEAQLTEAEHGDELATALREMIADVERKIRTWEELVRFAADPWL